MKTLQTKSQSLDNNNVVTISTGTSAMRLNNSSSSNADDFVAKQQQQLQQQQRITSTITSVAPKVMTNSNGTSTTINLTGPVTDL